MLQGATVDAPNGDRWRVGRRWMDRPLPSLKRRFRANREEAEDRGGGLDALSALDFADSPAVGIAAAVGLLLIFFVLLPLIGFAFEVLVLLLLLWSGIAGRVVLGRPWIVEAVNLDDEDRSTAFAVKGWRRSGRAAETRAGSPDRSCRCAGP